MNIPTYPLRPVNGGPLDKALPKSGKWAYQPKFNGWRAVVHVPTKTIFNRAGEKLSIPDVFSNALYQLTAAPFEWLDCEALERRHKIGQGSLIVLDCMTHGTWIERQLWLDKFFPEMPGADLMADNTVYLAPEIADPLNAWKLMQEVNAQLECDFYEGVVAKKIDSLYPRQLRSPEVEFPFWVKHRWKF